MSGTDSCVVHADDQSGLPESAADIAAAVRSGEVRAVEIIRRSLERVEEYDSILRAFISVVGRQALEHAFAIDEMIRFQIDPGRLAGVPVGIKDILPTRGIRTTFGSLKYRDYVPDADDVIVRNIRANGGIVIGKTNTPEFGAYVNTTNEVRGTTLNPHDVRLSPGGSSGGSAVALATGMCAVAHGADLGGSLRIPASYTGVVGMRPSIGRVPSDSDAWPFDGYSVHGPMARSVEDASLLLGAMSGGWQQGMAERERCASPWLRKFRVAWSPRLGNIFEVETEVIAAVEAAVVKLQQSGMVEIIADDPPFSGVAEAIMPLRALRTRVALSGQLDDSSQNRLLNELLLVSEHLTLADVANAEIVRSRVRRSVDSYMGRFDAILSVSTQTMPFLASDEYPPTIDGVSVADPLSAFLSTYAVSLIGYCAIALPIGLSKDGLPRSLQLICRSGHDDKLLAIAALVESIIGAKGTRLTSANLGS